MDQNNYGNQPANGYEGVNVTLPPQQPQKGKKGLAIAALILGIVSLIGFCCCINVITAPLAIIFGIIVLCKHMDGTGLAVTGIVTALLSLLLIGGIAYSVREILPYSQEIATDYMHVLEDQEEVFPAYEEDGTIPEYLEKYTESPYKEIWEKYDITFYDIMDALLEQYKSGTLQQATGYAVSNSSVENELDGEVELEPDMGLMIPA